MVADVERNWSKEDEDRLRDMFKRGLSAKQMALELGSGRTRSAVLGKLHRMELGRKSNAPATRPRKTQRQVETRKEISRVTWSSFNALRKEALAGVLKTEPLPPPAADPVIPAHKRITIEDLEPHHCRWPYGDSDHHFCGKQKVIGLSYCEQHARRAFVPPKPRRINVAAPARATKPEPIPTFADAIAEDLKV